MSRVWHLKQRSACKNKRPQRLTSSRCLVGNWWTGRTGVTGSSHQRHVQTGQASRARVCEGRLEVLQSWGTSYPPEEHLGADDMSGETLESLQEMLVLDGSCERPMAAPIQVLPKRG